jgi:hypothetical protein
MLEKVRGPREAVYIRVMAWCGKDATRNTQYNTYKTLFRVNCYFALLPRVANRARLRMKSQTSDVTMHRHIASTFHPKCLLLPCPPSSSSVHTHTHPYIY